MLASHELGVLTGLFPEKSPQTLKDIQKKCSYSYERIHSAVKSLDERGAIDMKRYGNVMVVTPNYNSDLAFLAYLHYMVSLKAKMFDEHRAAGMKSQTTLGKPKMSRLNLPLDDILSCLFDISGLDADLISITEVSRTPRNKISFFYSQRKSIESSRIDNLLLSMRYKYPNIKIEPRLESEEAIKRKREDLTYLNSVVVKGLENFYRIFYL
jgi:hypothetical protein